ncbi:MAG: aminoacyl-tRNA hydrolase [Patescibacteria group bacterium]
MIKQMKLIVGLGNPGDEHKENRHNVGFMVVDRLAEEAEWESKFEALILKSRDCLLVKPQMFMNRSGEVVAKLVNFYKVTTDDLMVIHDDLDIRLGEYKIQKGVGPKIHNGLTSVEEQLGTANFWRLRLGVDNRPAGQARTPGDEYVLSDFLPGEKEIIEGVMEKAVKELERI